MGILVLIHNSTLQNGTLHNGMFLNGTLHNGTFKMVHQKNGTLKNGTAVHVTKRYIKKVQ
jgi:hypothetical protein